MTMTMTLRRTSLAFLENLSEEQAPLFAMGIEDGADATSQDAIFDFYDWHVVHYLSSETAWDRTLPAGFMIGGANWVEIHPDHEPPQILSVEEVLSIRRHLDNLDTKVIDARCSKILAGDCGIYGEELSEDMVEIWKSAFHQIREFITQAAENGQVVVKAIE